MLHFTLSRTRTFICNHASVDTSCRRSLTLGGVSRMQGYLLDTMPTTDLYALRAQIKDAYHRLERAAYSRRISSIPALSFDELDTESTQDIFVSKGLESLED